MRYLGNRTSAVTPKEIAAALGVTVRSVQRALKELTAEEVGVKPGEGRGSGYRLEDTTFMEPTHARVLPD